MIAIGTDVVRTYIDQLAQVLSALVGWSRIEKCTNGGECTKGSDGNGSPHGSKGCAYLNEAKRDDRSCTDCGCLKWKVSNPGEEGTPLGRRCQRCSGGGDHTCQCDKSGGGCSPTSCKCAKEGKCCKCCCKSCKGKCSDKCSCVKEESEKKDLGIYVHKETYQSAYWSYTNAKHFEQYGMTATWNALYRYKKVNTNDPPSQRRHQCAQILLGSVCLIWSGVTYMHWTGKYAPGSPYWNNHILDGSGLDDGSLSQWLQALGFPREMLNGHGPRNRLDAVIWDGIRGMLYLGFPETGTGGSGVHGYDTEANTFRDPAGMNYAGYIHTMDKGAFCSKATVFKNGDDSSTSEENINKCGALYKLYILSCAYFTGLQKKGPPKAENRTPKTIREILYWLSALPYSPAYKQILEHSIERLKSVAPKNKDGTETLSFLQTGRSAPITVHEFNLFAHFQAVTQYCPLVLIGIQGGLHSTNSTTPAIHSLYANTECNFTYPEVPIQAYNQVVHYIRALFYQLYFLRKQCAVKVAQGGKWRECRYGNGVVSKGVISWMCLGCDPMEHDRKWRVGKVGTEILKGMKKGSLAEELKNVLLKVGDVVVQLANAQQALEGKEKGAIDGVKEKLKEAKMALDKVKDLNGLNGDRKLEEAKKKLVELTNGGDKGILKDVADEVGKATGGQYDPGKNKISAAIKGVRDALEALEKEVPGLKDQLNDQQGALIKAVKAILEIVGTTKCVHCHDHSMKCGRQGEKKTCTTCHQQYMDGTPSPLQAFLEDRLPGFSCEKVVNQDGDQADYPPAVFPYLMPHHGGCLAS